jgi:hypothetical protein
MLYFERSRLEFVDGTLVGCTDAATVTIGKLARATEGVKSVPYDRGRRLLAVPHSGGVRILKMQS